MEPGGTLTIPRLLSTFFIVGLVGLAGCVGSSPQDLGAGDAALDGLVIDETHGAIEGLVTDSELNPVGLALIGLRGLDIQRKTDSQGRFLLPYLAAGSYTLDVQKLGYQTRALPVIVEADKIVRRNVVLEPVALQEERYYVAYPWTGRYTCALGTEAWVSSCTYPYTAAYYTLEGAGVNASQYGLPEDLQENRFRYNFTILPSAKEVVSEMSWKSTSAASKRMQMSINCGDYDPVADTCGTLVNPHRPYAEVQGESPLRIVWKPPTEFDKRPVNWVMARGDLPFYQAQVALDQKFDIWNAVFYGQKAPDGFSLVVGEG